MSTYVNIPDNRRDTLYPPTVYFNMDSKKLAKFVCLLPLFGFTFAVMWSILFNFQKSTYTHCQVFNFFPSISAAIGYPPCDIVWRITIALHSMPRFLYLVANYEFHRKKPMMKLSSHQQLLSFVGAFLNGVENFGLILLTFVSSSDNHPVHALGFSLFVIGSMFYMVITNVLRHSMSLETPDEVYGLRWMKIFSVANISSVLLGMFFYWRHNAYCEPGVYSLFCLFEYIVIISNIGFHYATCMSLGPATMNLEVKEQKKS